MSPQPRFSRIAEGEVGFGMNGEYLYVEYLAIRTHRESTRRTDWAEITCFSN